MILEHEEISRTHGRETTDHPDAVAELSKLPVTLWSAGPTDVGLDTCSPVLFQLKSEAPINRPQYRNKPEAEEGISETIEGLLKVGVLEPSQSFWNTPILPVEKHHHGKSDIYTRRNQYGRFNGVTGTTRLRQKSGS